MCYIMTYSPLQRQAKIKTGRNFPVLQYMIDDTKKVNSASWLSVDSSRKQQQQRPNIIVECSGSVVDNRVHSMSTPPLYHTC